MIGNIVLIFVVAVLLATLIIWSIDKSGPSNNNTSSGGANGDKAPDDFNL
jgi:hypothetical protein